MKRRAFIHSTLTALAASGWLNTAIASTMQEAVYAHGEPPAEGLGGPLPLTMHDGRPFATSRIIGAPTLLFFGFTRCGDACPVAMAQAVQVLSSFRAGKPPNIVFVTLDPLSDPPEVLASYLAGFDKRIIGLTGSPEQIEATARRYGVGVGKRAGPLEHSSRWYLLNDNARLVRVYKIDTPVAAMVQDIIRGRTHRSASVWREDPP